MSVYRCIADPQHRLAFLDHLAPLNTKNLYLFFQFLKPVPLFTCFYCDAYKKRKKTRIIITFKYQPLEQDNQVSFSYSTFLGYYLAKGEKRSRKFALQTQIHHCYLLFIIPVPFFYFFASSLPGSGLVHTVYHSTSYLISLLLRHCLVYLLCEAACILTSHGSHSLHLQLTTLLSNTGPT